MASVPSISPRHRRLYQEAKRFDPDNESAARQLHRLQTENLRLKTKLRALETSTFWRATAPLRFAMDKARAARMRLFRKASVPLHFEEGTVAIDISTLRNHDAGTGIQRVVRKIAVELASAARDSKRIVLCDYSSGVPLDVTGSFLGAGTVADPPNEITGIEMLIMLDSSYNLAPSFSRRLREAKREGVFVVSICHDLLPVTNPEWFLAVNYLPFRRWLHLAADYSSAFLCVSETTATRLHEYLAAKTLDSPPAVAPWPLGHDLDSSPPPTANGSPDCESYALMVGTVEPRKNHSFVAKALAEMRSAGKNPPHLVVVGKYGWKNKSAVRLLRQGEKEGWITWHDHGISDEELAELYAQATCMIQASLDEGFGLPVAEGAAFGKPVVLSDISVFREIVREDGYFFRLGDTKSFAEALAAACAPEARPTKTKAVTWQESADIFWKQCLEMQAAARAREVN